MVKRRATPSKVASACLRDVERDLELVGHGDGGEAVEDVVRAGHAHGERRRAARRAGTALKRVSRPPKWMPRAQ